MKHALFALLFVAAVFAVPAPLSHAAPKAELWPKWEAHNADSDAAIDHSVWDAFLRNYLSERDGINLLNYGGVSESDRKELDEYIAALMATDIAAHNRDQQRAFWINLYNALTARVILAHYPVESIMDIDISPGVFASGPWGKKLIMVGGEELSLDDIEHRILRPIWRDARIHYAVNCASIGCPNLALRAWTAENAEEMLEAGARAYVNHPRGAKVEDGRLLVSSIYEWFKEDFGGDDDGVISHLRGYADGELRGQLEGISSVSGDDYDWNLNDAK